jgi:hypothetical protein
MNVISYCKDLNIREIMDDDAFKNIRNEIAGWNQSPSDYKVIISDDHHTINALRKRHSSESLILMPAVALLKQDSPYSSVHDCIKSGAVAIVIRAFPLKQA